MALAGTKLHFLGTLSAGNGVICSKVQMHGGTCSLRLGPHLTHIIVGEGATGEKLVEARCIGRPLVAESWIDAAIATGNFRSLDSAAHPPPGALAPVAPGAATAHAAAASSASSSPVAAVSAPPGPSKRALEDPVHCGAGEAKCARPGSLLEQLLAASDAEVTAGGSPTQLRALADRLPGLGKHILDLVSQEEKPSVSVPGLVVVNFTCKDSHGKTRWSHTNVNTAELIARLGDVNVSLTLRCCEVVNAEAVYNAWWLKDLGTGNTIYPKGPVKLTDDGEMVGDGAGIPALADLVAFRARCNLSGGAECSTQDWFRSILAELVRESRERCSTDMTGSGIFDELEEFLSPEANPEIAAA